MFFLGSFRSKPFDCLFNSFQCFDGDSDSALPEVSVAIPLGFLAFFSMLL